jgi:hypothetical protein
VLAARTIVEFQWAVYSFNCGHFLTSIRAGALPFRIVLVADAFVEGRSLFKEFSDCTIILDGARELYNHIRNSGDNSVLDGYLIHSHRFPSSENNHAFWQLQASIVVGMRKIRGLSLFVAIVHRDHDNRSVGLFCSTLKRKNWILSDTEIYFPSYGDSVADQARVVIGVHATTAPSVVPVTLPPPPSLNPPPIASYLWHPFNSREYAVSFARDSPKFGSPVDESDCSNVLVATTVKPDPAFSKTPSPEALYCLHPSDADASNQVGSVVFSTAKLCPPFSSVKNSNIFRHHFGIEYPCERIDGKDGVDTLVRPISPFEFVKCFNLSDDITYKLSHASNLFSMDGALPAATSSFILRQCHERLIDIRTSNIQIYDPDHLHTAPAALCNVFISGATGTRLPDAAAWVRAYDEDPETRLIRQLVLNPSEIYKATLLKLDSNYRMPIRESLIVLENDMLIYRTPLGDGSSSYCKLRIVPKPLQNIVFIAFHANPIGGHLNWARTYNNIRLRYYWPGMYRQDTQLFQFPPILVTTDDQVTTVTTNVTTK